MFDKMKQVMEMKRQADQLKKELDAAHVTVDEVRGITITINGSQKFKSIEIDGAKISAENKTSLESDILKAVNAAIRQSQNVAAEKMKKLMPAGFPGL